MRCNMTNRWRFNFVESPEHLELQTVFQDQNDVGSEFVFAKALTEGETESDREPVKDNEDTNEEESWSLDPARTQIAHDQHEVKART